MPNDEQDELEQAAMYTRVIDPPPDQLRLMVAGPIVLMEKLRVLVHTGIEWDCGEFAPSTPEKAAPRRIPPTNAMAKPRAKIPRRIGPPNLGNSKVYSLPPPPVRCPRLRATTCRARAKENGEIRREGA
ncbi:MAG: hypothetical protein L3K04_07925 [Thermoplasmata archaeon]|nr:hypothetical protein [Thermoplasmata archaeon]